MVWQSGIIVFFGGAIYLYTINCVFICVATFLIVKFLKYPRLVQFEKTREKQITYVITILTVVLLLPSIYFGFTLFEERKFEQKVNSFIQNEFTEKGYTIIYKKTRYKSNPSSVEIAFLSKRFTPQESAEINQRLKIYDLKGIRFKIRQDTTNLKQDILNQIKNEKANVDEKDAIIATLRKEIEDNKFDNNSLLNEARILFPSLTDISISNHPFNVSQEKKDIVPVVIYSSVKSLNIEDTKKLEQWIKIRIKKNTVEVFWKSTSS